MDESTTAVVVGTRPDAIKLAPLVRELRRRGAPARVISTGQHRDLLGPILELFEVDVAVELDVMRDGQSLPDLHAALVSGMGRTLRENAVEKVVVQGDTSSALAGGIAAHYEGIPVAHVEAGLRTRNLEAPWPEEFHRQALARVARWHFAPTDVAAENLRKESVSGSIHVVGNTVIDALHHVVERLDSGAITPAPTPVGDRDYILVTCHRREQSRDDFAAAITALRKVARVRHDLDFLYPVHPNPIVRGAVEAGLRGIDNIYPCRPLPYPDFVAAMRSAAMILTDSGGVQEEATALGKPLLVMREASDRPESITAGLGRIVGVDADAILEAMERPPAAAPSQLYGEGAAAPAIADVLLGRAASDL